MSQTDSDILTAAPLDALCPACHARRVLVLACGNPARGDDGIGPLLAAEIEDWALPGVTVACDYQLNVEDAVAVAEHDVVLFLDAACSGRSPFELRPIAPTREVTFSSHSVTPDNLLALARQVSGKSPAAFALGVRGYNFDMFCEQLSPLAAASLDAARTFLRTALRHRRFEDLVESGLRRSIGQPSEPIAQAIEPSGNASALGEDTAHRAVAHKDSFAQQAAAHGQDGAPACARATLLQE